MPKTSSLKTKQQQQQENKMEHPETSKHTLAQASTWHCMIQFLKNLKIKNSVNFNQQVGLKITNHKTTVWVLKIKRKRKLIVSDDNIKQSTIYLRSKYVLIPLKCICYTLI